MSHALHAPRCPSSAKLSSSNVPDEHFTTVTTALWPESPPESPELRVITTSSFSFPHGGSCLVPGGDGRICTL